MIDYISLYKEFVTNPKSLLIAPAGYGKTYTISECLKFTRGRQLILTHTHAGIASIKSKIVKSYPNCNYSIETIASFAQKYVDAFILNSNIPNQEDKEYYSFIIKKATELLQINPIIRIIQISYSGLFVDEYQDCTISQHQFIISLAKLIPTHILGDPLQGIFSFNGENLVDFKKDLSDFTLIGELDEPWRWKNKNPQIGLALDDIRNKLEKTTSINLLDYKDVHGFHFLQTEPDKIREKGSDYRNWLNRLTYNPKDVPELNNLLIITPNSRSIWHRVEINKILSYKYYILEAFDEMDFYNYSRELDSILEKENIYNSILVFLKGKLKRRKGKKSTRSGTLITGLNNYFRNENILPKPTKKSKKNINHIINHFSNIEITKSKSELFTILNDILSLADVRCTRKEIFYDLCKAIKQASIKGTSILDAMNDIRLLKRRKGRNTFGKIIGTTLLTKGLEFDTVVILDADKFNCPKNFYVAVTRAVFKLIIFSNSLTFSFHNPYAKIS